MLCRGLVRIAVVVGVFALLAGDLVAGAVLTFGPGEESTKKSFGVMPPGNYADEEFTVENRTGITWTDFHFELISPTTIIGDPESFNALFWDFGAVGPFDGIPYESPFGGTVTVMNPTPPDFDDGPAMLWVDGITVSSDVDFTFNLDFTTTLAGEIFFLELFGTPSFDATPAPPTVPEPSSFLLWGLAGITAIGRRRRRSA
jgi:hypothetical protein